MRHPCDTNNLIERWHRTLKTMHSNYKRNRRVATLISDILLVSVARFHIFKLSNEKTQPQKKFRAAILARETSARALVEGKHVSRFQPDASLNEPDAHAGVGQQCKECGGVTLEPLAADGSRECSIQFRVLSKASIDEKSSADRSYTVTLGYGTADCTCMDELSILCKHIRAAARFGHLKGLEHWCLPLDSVRASAIRQMDQEQASTHLAVIDDIEMSDSDEESESDDESTVVGPDPTAMEEMRAILDRLDIRTRTATARAIRIEMLAIEDDRVRKYAPHSFTGKSKRRTAQTGDTKEFSSTRAVASAKRKPARPAALNKSIEQYEYEAELRRTGPIASLCCWCNVRLHLG